MKDPRMVGDIPPQMLRNEPPKLAIQARNIGGEFGMFKTPESWPTWYFNPGVMDYQGKRYLAARKFWMDYEQYWDFRSHVAFMEIHPDMTLGEERIMTYKLRDPRESVEDPRCSIIGGRPAISCCAWVPPQKVTSPHHQPKIIIHQSLFRLGDDWNVDEIWDVPYGGNGPDLHYGDGAEKNWLWFEHDGQPHFIYQTEPHIVCSVKGGKVDEEFKTYASLGWTLGSIRGGTPPIRVGEHYLSFFHSSMPWKRLPRYGVRRMYFAGAYLFEAKPPFQIVAATRTDRRLLSGTWNEPTAESVPAVVYPTGALLDGDEWFITLGVNDCRCGWMRIPHEKVMARMQPCT